MTDQPLDPYEVLGVSRQATQDEISSAFRALLRRHHPDTRWQDPAVGSDSVLRDVLAAYGVLRDPGLRAAYDRQLHERTPQVSDETPRVPVAVRTHRAPQPPIVAGPISWEPPASRRR